MQIKPIEQAFVDAAVFSLAEEAMSQDRRVRVAVGHPALPDVRIQKTVPHHMIVGGRPHPDLALEMCLGLWCMTPEAIDEGYANVPQSISELKADKTANASFWTPRDALVDLLRRIDSSPEKRIDALVVVYREKKYYKPGEPEYGLSTYYSAAAPDLHASLGLLNRATHMINSAAEEMR